LASAVAVFVFPMQAECKFLNVQKVSRLVVGREAKGFGTGGETALEHERFFSFEESGGKTVVALECASMDQRDAYVSALRAILDTYGARYAFDTLGVAPPPPPPPTDPLPPVRPLIASDARPSTTLPM
jgi:hypothetical protein